MPSVAVRRSTSSEVEMEPLLDEKIVEERGPSMLAMGKEKTGSKVPIPNALSHINAL